MRKVTESADSWKLIFRYEEEYYGIWNYLQ
jgi:hypothetical protein